MSMPIPRCLISKAACGDEGAYQALLKAMKYNLTQPAYSIMGCRCNPACPEPTEQQFENLNNRLNSDLKAYAAKNRI